MRNFIRRILSLILAMTVSMQLQAMTPEKRQHITDSLNAILPRLDNANDSLDVLYDLVDVADYKTRSDAALRAYQVSRRTDNIAARGDLLRRISNFNLSNDTMQALALEEAARLPEGNIRSETELFIKTQRITGRARYTTGAERQRSLINLISNYKKMFHDEVNSTGESRFYERLEKLYALCIYMSLSTRSHLLVDYVDSLGREIEKLPKEMQSIRNLYYTSAAIAYTNSEVHDKAVWADKMLLAIMDQLEASNHSKGREFSDYNLSRYNSYRRILSNYPALTDREVDYYYDKIKEIAREYPDAESDFNNLRRPTIYYLMAKKRYAEVLPILKVAIEEKKHEPFRRRFTAFIVEAAQATGDQQSLLKASLDYNKILEDFISTRADENLSELQVVYHVSSLLDENEDLRVNSRDFEVSRQKRSLIVLMVLGAILVVLLIVGVVFYMRSKRLAVNLGKSNETLKNERDTLRRTQDELIKARDRARQADRHKTDFINNMSHEVSVPLNTIVEYSQLIVENVDEDKRAYLERFAQAIDVSADLLRTLINDVLDISSLDNTQLSVVKHPVGVNLLCETAMATRSLYAKEGVDLVFDNAGSKDTVIITDRRRVEQVLINLLSNASKFTEEGVIHLGYRINQPEHLVTFYVSDTGIGIPEEKREVIFERFVKLNRFSQGNGLGLAICRMIAKLLGGRIWVDGTYPGPGTRVCFEIPTD